MTLPISNYRFAILSGDEPRSSEDRQVAVLNGPFTIFDADGELINPRRIGKRERRAHLIGNLKSKM
jgi:hypothetical protein